MRNAINKSRCTTCLSYHVLQMVFKFKVVVVVLRFARVCDFLNIKQVFVELKRQERLTFTDIPTSIITYLSNSKCS